MTATDPTELAARLHRAISTVIRGKPDVVRLALSTLLGGGHLLMADLPGTGKTLLAKTIAASIGGRFGRVQCTPDLLPSDIVGTSIFQPVAGQWDFREGPVFANVLLVDEINRASPRTQSALLEPMEEHQVTVDGSTRALPRPFFCIATQNPSGQIGTFPLPESQLDRFALVVSMGLPGREFEREIVTGIGGNDALARLDPVTTPDEVGAAVAAIRAVHCAPPVVEYLLDLADATRRHPQLSIGASPRATTGLLAVARAHAVVCGRDYVTPNDVQSIMQSRVGPSGQRGRSGRRGHRVRHSRHDPDRDPGPDVVNEHAQGIRARPTGFGLLLAAVCVLAAVGGARSADPQVAGLAWVVLGAVVLVGAIWPICAVAAVQVRVLACDVDATVGGEVGLDVALIGWSSSLELRLAGSTDDGWHRVGAPGSGRLPCPAVARGRYEQLVVEVASSAPLGVLRARRRVALTLPSPLFVGPTAVDVEWHPDLIERGSVDGTSSLASLSGDVVRSVRPYAPGDPSHLVHWPSSARAGALMVRELEPPSEVGVAVIVEIGDHAGRAEEVASHAAGMVLAVTSAGGRLVLCTHDAGGARSDVVVTLTHAMRLLAAATPGAPGSPPSGWPIAAVHP